MRYILLFLFPMVFVVTVCPGFGYAEESAGSRNIILFFENDAFFGTDSLYTNGFRLSWTSPDLKSYGKESRLGRWADSMIDWLPFANQPDLTRSFNLGFGQNMYTPEDTQRADLIEDERPYAGLTYLNLGLYGKSNTQMNAWNFGAGILGPLSFAEDTQRFIHELGGSDFPQGWDNQLDNEPFFNVFFEHRRKLFASEFGNGWGYDVIPNIGGGAGNLFVGAHVGAQVRLGWNLPRDFGTSLIRPGTDTNAPAYGPAPSLKDPWSNLGVHVFAGVDGSGTLRNVTLDGNTFGDSHSVEKNPLVGTALVGFGLTVYRFKVSFTHVFMTKQYNTQKNSEQYGSITISYSY